LNPSMDDFVEKFRRTAELMGHEETHLYLPVTTNWKSPSHFKNVSDEFLAEYEEVRRQVEVHILLRRGDSLMSLATKEIRKADWEYYSFQATMALDSYRAGYNLLLSCQTVNVEIEGKCLWSMAKVMSALGLEERAHELYLHAVVMAGEVSPRMPTGEWYADSITQIQIRRKIQEAHETKMRNLEREGVMASLSLEVCQLRSRAQRVNDEISLREFFAWLLQTHKSLDIRFKDAAREALGPREASKIALNVAAVYDVQKNAEFGERWLVLCEEIIKIVNRFFGASGCVIFNCN